MSAEDEGRRGRIPHGAEQAIEHQRLQLMRASTVLTCLWITTLYQEWHDVEIDAADVALLVRRVIDEAIDALDSVVLARSVDGPTDGSEPARSEEPDENDRPDEDDGLEDDAAPDEDDDPSEDDD